MSEISMRKETRLTPSEIVDLLTTAYVSSDELGQILTADVPWRSPSLRSSFDARVGNAQRRYSESVERLSADPELQELSGAIHDARCGCVAKAQREGCDWHIAGSASSAKARYVLHAGEFKANGIPINEITDHPEIFNKFIDYLEASREDRPRLQSELQELIDQANS